MIKLQSDFLLCQVCYCSKNAHLSKVDTCTTCAYHVISSVDVPPAMYVMRLSAVNI